MITNENDPILTAYALGELDASERAEVEAYLANSPEARAAVAEILDTAELLIGELQREPADGLDEAAREKILAAATGEKPVAQSPPRRRLPRWVAYLATASAVLVVGLTAVHLAGRSANRTFTTVGGQLGGGGASPLLSANSGEVREDVDREDAWYVGHLADDNESVASKVEGTTKFSVIAQGKIILPDSHKATLDSSKKYGKLAGTEFSGVAAGGSKDGDAEADYLPVRDVTAGIGRITTQVRPEELEQQQAVTINSGSARKVPSRVTFNKYRKGRLSGKWRPLTANGKSRERGEVANKGRTLEGSGLYAADLQSHGKPTALRSKDRAGLVELEKRVSEITRNESKVQRDLVKLRFRPKSKDGEGKPGVRPLKPLTAGESRELGERQVLRERLLVRQVELAKAKKEYRRAIEWYRRMGRTSTSNTEAYDFVRHNPFLSPRDEKYARSTFGVDVDSASYANVRRFLTRHQRPPAGAVRIEELVNYFDYDYPQPEGKTPFSINVEVAGCPWQPGHRLVRIGLQGKEIAKHERPPTNLVFLLDVSGSMADHNKLPLVKSAMRVLVEELDERDRVAIVTYAGSAGTALPSTPADQQADIIAAIEALRAGGSTNGAAGIQTAYNLAVQNFLEDGANRVILCTDGDFNVGISEDSDLVRMITGKAKSGVFLSIFGFGMGNLKDAKLEKLADKGNGHYGYIDSQREAHRVFVERLTGTLLTIAKDVKIQVEFNPGRVGAYRLIGYENRVMPNADFNDDSKDAGDIGAGHAVTALYEIVPAGEAAEKLAAAGGDTGLKYQKPVVERKIVDSKELLTVSLKYKQPDAEKSEEKIERAVVDGGKTFAQSSRDFQWASAVVSFGMILRGTPQCGDSSLPAVLEIALSARGEDKAGRRGEFVKLVRAAMGQSGSEEAGEAR